MEITHILKKIEKDIENHKKIGNIETKTNGHTKEMQFRTKNRNPTKTRLMNQKIGLMNPRTRLMNPRTRLTNQKKEISNLQIENSQENSQDTMTKGMNFLEELRDILKIERINYTQDPYQKTSMKKLSQNLTPNNNPANTVHKNHIATTTKVRHSAIQNPIIKGNLSSTLKSSTFRHRNIHRIKGIIDLHKSNDNATTIVNTGKIVNSATIVNTDMIMNTVPIVNTETIVRIALIVKIANTVNIRNLLTITHENNPATKKIRDIKKTHVVTKTSHYKDKDQSTEKNTLPEKIWTSKLTTDDPFPFVSHLTSLL
jgi:hypothetical protein